VPAYVDTDFVLVVFCRDESNGRTDSPLCVIVFYALFCSGCFSVLALFLVFFSVPPLFFLTVYYFFLWVFALFLLWFCFRLSVLDFHPQNPPVFFSGFQCSPHWFVAFSLVFGSPKSPCLRLCPSFLFPPGSCFFFASGFRVFFFYPPPPSAFFVLWLYSHIMPRLPGNKSTVIAGVMAMHPFLFGRVKKKMNSVDGHG